MITKSEIEKARELAKAAQACELIDEPAMINFQSWALINIDFILRLLDHIKAQEAELARASGFIGNISGAFEALKKVHTEVLKQCVRIDGLDMRDINKGFGDFNDSIHEYLSSIKGEDGG